MKLTLHQKLANKFWDYISVNVFRISTQTFYLLFIRDWSTLFGLQTDYKQKPDHFRYQILSCGVHILHTYAQSDLHFDGSLNYYGGDEDKWWGQVMQFSVLSLLMWPRLHKRACLIIYNGAQCMPRWYCWESCEWNWDIEICLM